MRGYSPWLICGTPCSGETTFGNWLRDQQAYQRSELATEKYRRRVRAAEEVDELPISPYLKNLRDHVGTTLLLLPTVAAVIHDEDGRVLL